MFYTLRLLDLLLPIAFILFNNCNIDDHDRTGVPENPGSAIKADLEINLSSLTFKKMIHEKPVGICVNGLTSHDEYDYRAVLLKDALQNMQTGTLRLQHDGTYRDWYLFHHPDKLEELAAPFAKLEPYVYDKSGSSIEIPIIDVNKVLEYPGYRLNMEGKKKTIDFNDFVKLCDELSITDPFIEIPVEPLLSKPERQKPEYLTEEKYIELAVGWVRYANKVLKRNYHYWELGNETWADYYSAPEPELISAARRYAALALKFAKAMKAEDPNIKIGVNGIWAAWYKTVLTYSDQNGKLIDYIDFLIPHQYGKYPFQSYDKYISTSDIPLDYLNHAISSINPTNIPNGSKREEFKVHVTEVSSYLAGAGANTPHAAINTLMNFEIISRVLLADKVGYVHFWTTHWTSDNENTSALFINNKITPMGWSVKLLNNYLYNEYAFIKAQSPSLIVYLTKSSDDHQKLTVFFLNKLENEQSISVQLSDFKGNLDKNTINVLSALKADGLNSKYESCGTIVPLQGVFNIVLKPVSITILTFDPDKFNLAKE